MLLVFLPLGVCLDRTSRIPSFSRVSMARLMVLMLAHVISAIVRWLGHAMPLSLAMSAKALRTAFSASVSWNGFAHFIAVILMSVIFLSVRCLGFVEEPEHLLAWVPSSLVFTVSKYFLRRCF